jgi:hypothetical protein
LTTPRKTGTVEVEFRVGCHAPGEIDRAKSTSEIEMSCVLRKYPRVRRGIVSLAAAVLILAQLLSAAHFHPFAGPHKYSANSIAAIGDGLCAECLLHFNTPYASAALPTAAAPLWSQSVGVAAVQPRLFASYRSSLFSRAPPASV